MLRFRHINRAVFALCLLAPWSLLWLDASLVFPYETGKAWLFRLIIECTFALYLVQRFSQPFALVKGVHRWMLLVLALYFAWNLLTLFSGIDPYRSFWSNYERMSGFIALIHWAMYFLCLSSVMKTERIGVFCANLLVILAIICALSNLDSEKRAISTLGNPIYLGNIAVLGMFISGFSLSTVIKSPSNTKWAWIVFTLVFICLSGLALLNAASRGPIVALIAGVIAMLIYAFVSLIRQKSTRQAMILLFVATTSLITVFSVKDEAQKMLRQSDSYAFSRLGQISLTNQTTADRLENWQIALEASKTHPVLGWGQGNYMMAFTEHYRAGIMDNARIWFDRAHNAYLDVLVASGYPGLVLYLLMLGIPFWLVSGNTNWSLSQKLFVIGFFAAFMSKNLVGFDTFSSSLLWLTVLAFSFSSTAHNEQRSHLLLTTTGRRLLVVFSIVYLTGAYYLNIKPYQDNQYLAQLSATPQNTSTFSNRPFPEAIESISGYALNSKLRIYSELLTQSSNNNQALNNALHRKQLFHQVGELVRRELERQPRNYRLSYNASKLMADLGHYNLAIRLLESLVRAAPERTVFWHQLSKTYLAAGENYKSKQAADIVFDLNPNWKYSYN